VKFEETFTYATNKLTSLQMTQQFLH